MRFIFDSPGCFYRWYHQYHYACQQESISKYRCFKGAHVPELQILRNETLKACILVDYYHVREWNNMNAFLMKNMEAIQCQIKVDVLRPFRNVSDKWHLVSPWNLGCRLSSSTLTCLSGNVCALVSCISWGSEYLER